MTAALIPTDTFPLTFTRPAIALRIMSSAELAPLGEDFSGKIFWPKFSRLLLSGVATALSSGLFWSVTFLTRLMAERVFCGVGGARELVLEGLQKSWEPRQEERRIFDFNAIGNFDHPPIFLEL